MAEEYRSGYAALVGEPNVGKSTLMNALLQQKLSIVTAKPQTTRQRVLGILSDDHYQIIFLDTPGIVTPQYQLHEFMLTEISKSLEDASVTVLMVDAGAPFEQERALLKLLQKTGGDAVLVINKIDTVRKTDLLPVIEKWNGLFGFREIVPVSALTGDGTDRLETVLAEAMPPGPPFYPPDQVAQQPERFFAAELIRETIFETMKKEIPYAAAVLVEPFRTRGKKTYLEAMVAVERDSQKRILIGKGGANLKRIGSAARQKIEEFLELEIFLDIRVKVHKDWKKDRKAMNRLGYI